MTEKEFGRKINSVRPVMEYSRNHMRTKDNLKKVDQATQKLKKLLGAKRT